MSGTSSSSGDLAICAVIVAVLRVIVRICALIVTVLLLHRGDLSSDREGLQATRGRGFYFSRWSEKLSRLRDPKTGQGALAQDCLCKTIMIA